VPQIGALIGKGGSIINSMREETGAHIRVLPREALPASAHQSDELVQVQGEITVVRAALQNISARLRAHPVRVSAGGGGGGGGGGGSGGGGNRGNYGGHPHSMHAMAHSAAMHHQHHLAAVAGMRGGPGFLPMAPPVMPQMALQAPPPGTEIHYRLLCPAVRSGSLIGRQGSVIRALREESGARIKVHAYTVRSQPSLLS
jgi:predicted RNA-binding protein YlqC (UPF0109 family)